MPKDDSDNDYFFIIDEINRGNLSKIFGELFMLIENDKRGHQEHAAAPLLARACSHVPSNVYLIGMMNTADRSLAHARLRPAPPLRVLRPPSRPSDAESFIAYQRGTCAAQKFDNLVSCVARLNDDDRGDESLGSRLLHRPQLLLPHVPGRCDGRYSSRQSSTTSSCRCCASTGSTSPTKVRRAGLSKLRQRRSV